MQPSATFFRDNPFHPWQAHLHDGEPPLEFHSSPSSATAALIQADVFTSKRISAGSLLRVRIFCALWMTMGVLLVPLCEFSGGSCALGVSRGGDGDVSFPGERGNLVGEGQPLPDSDSAITPMGAHARTLWTMASLSYVLSFALLAYLLLLVILSIRHRMLLKQCASYSYASLSIVSHASTAAHPLTLDMKLAALLFQIVIPSTIGMAAIYVSCILPYRRPLSWPLSLHLHVATALIATFELLYSRFLFRLRALAYWFVAALLYLLLLLVAYLRADRWVYSNLDWRHHSVSLVVVVWVGSFSFLGPLCFGLGALAQYGRDGLRRGMLQAPEDIAAEQSRAAHMEQSLLAQQGAYIQGALASHAAAHDAAASPGFGDGAPSHARNIHANGGDFLTAADFHTPSAQHVFQPTSVTRGGGGPAAPHPPPLLTWPSDIGLSTSISSSSSSSSSSSFSRSNSVGASASPPASAWSWVRSWWTLPRDPA